MEIIVDITKAVYKERIVRCKDCRKKYACVTFEGIANENGFCSMGETEADRKTEPSGSEKPSNCDGCKEGQEDCYGCPFVKWDEPKTERTCTNCKHNGVLSVPKCDECHDMDKHEFIEPQTDCSWR